MYKKKGSVISRKPVLLADSDVPSLLAIAYKFGDWIITLLQLYIIINVAFIGWILTYKPVWDISQKIPLSVVYLTAMFTNLLWMWKLKCWLTDIIKQIQVIANNKKFPNLTKVESIIVKVQNPYLWILLFVFHFLSDLAVIWTIFCY